MWGKEKVASVGEPFETGRGVWIWYFMPRRYCPLQLEGDSKMSRSYLAKVSGTNSDDMLIIFGVYFLEDKTKVRERSVILAKQQKI